MVIQGTTVSAVAKLLKLSIPLEESVHTFGIELPEELDSNLSSIVVTKEMIEKADTLQTMELPAKTLVMIVKRDEEFLIPNGSLKLKANDVLLLISERNQTKEALSSTE